MHGASSEIRFLNLRGYFQTMKIYWLSANYSNIQAQQGVLIIVQIALLGKTVSKIYDNRRHYSGIAVTRQKLNLHGLAMSQVYGGGSPRLRIWRLLHRHHRDIQPRGERQKAINWYILWCSVQHGSTVDMEWISGGCNPSLSTAITVVLKFCPCCPTSVIGRSSCTQTGSCSWCLVFLF